MSDRSAGAEANEHTLEPLTLEALKQHCTSVGGRGGQNCDTVAGHAGISWRLLLQGMVDDHYAYGQSDPDCVGSQVPEHAMLTSTCIT